MPVQKGWNLIESTTYFRVFQCQIYGLYLLSYALTSSKLAVDIFLDKRFDFPVKYRAENVLFRKVDG